MITEPSADMAIDHDTVAPDRNGIATNPPAADHRAACQPLLLTRSTAAVAPSADTADTRLPLHPGRVPSPVKLAGCASADPAAIDTTNVEASLIAWPFRESGTSHRERVQETGKVRHVQHRRRRRAIAVGVRVPRPK